MSENTYTLSYRLEGIDSLKQALKGQRIVSLLHPKTQTLSETWALLLRFDSGKVVKVSSIFSPVGGWQEMGSLLFSDGQEISHKEFSEVLIDGFLIEKNVGLCFEDEEVYAEVGIKLVSEDMRELIVMSSVSPGSVSVKSDFFSGDFVPEVRLEDCKELDFSS